MITNSKRKRLVIIDDKYGFRGGFAYWMPDEIWDIVKEFAGIYNLKLNYLTTK